MQSHVATQGPPAKLLTAQQPSMSDITRRMAPVRTMMARSQCFHPANTPSRRWHGGTGRPRRSPRRLPPSCRSSLEPEAGAGMPFPDLVLADVEPEPAVDQPAAGGSAGWPSTVADTPPLETPVGLDGTEAPRTPPPRFQLPPRLLEVLAFAGPGLGMVLADPLMSLIDTACVGHVSSAQLAAMGPNAAIFNAVFSIFSFLGVATTNAVAADSILDPALSEREREAARARVERLVGTTMVLAVAFGFLALGALWTQGQPILARMGADAEVLPHALAYLRLRALAAPAVMLGNVAMGVCLGQQDTMTPFLVFMGAGLLNLGGDILLIFGFGMGVAGAAAATAASQVLSTAIFMLYLWHRGQTDSRRLKIRWTGWPEAAALRQFQKVAVTMITRTAFGMAAYFSMAVSATGLGVTGLAAHQVSMQIFWFLSYVPETLSLAAQSMIARDRRIPRAGQAWSRLLLGCGAALGVTLALALVAVFKRGLALFTTDPAVIAQVGAIWPMAAAALALCSCMMIMDGISVGSNVLDHLPISNVVGLAVTLGVLRTLPGTLTSVWWSLLAFYATRSLGHAIYYTWRHPHTAFGEQALC
ncbi:hypothetical protein ACKKBF_B19130 [Auxenochlorella protothecoides x Auxenochlorella symbiontica]